VDFRVLIAGQFKTVPVQPMRIRVLSVAGNVAASLHTAAGGYDANGWFADTAGSVAAFTNNGEPRVLTYTPDQNNTLLDTATRHFMLQVRGASVFANSVWLAATVNLTSIADLRQE
jgi:hypothetical protein